MVNIKIYSIAGKKIIEESRESFPDPASFLSERGVWIDVADYEKVDLDDIAKKIGLDPLTVEDIIEGKQRVKIDDYPEYNYAVCKGVSTAPQTGLDFVIEEISMVIREKLVISFHKSDSSIMTKVSRAMLNRQPGIGKNAHFTSTLIHLIYDFSVDTYYDCLSGIDSWLISTGGDVMDVDRMQASDLAGMKNIMRFISKARRQMNELRITMTQFRDVMAMLQRGSVKYIVTTMSAEFRDVYDHTFQLIETIDSYMLRSSDIRDLYFTLRAAFTDNVLKFLTVIATIFLPLTFLTGFYGMNFTNGFIQPGSNSTIGFYALVVAMIALPLFMAIYFHRRGWI